MSHRFIATCARRLEPVLASELSELGLKSVEPLQSAVAFEGPLADGYRACLWSRVASRVLLPLKRIYAPTAGALYTGVCKVHWKEHLDPRRTFAVNFVGTSEPIRNSHFGALKVKDAIVDTMRKFTGDRPNVDANNPDVGVHVHLDGERATISIDLSGSPLHLRGHNRDGGPAPLKETLAAAVLQLAGWHRLVDEDVVLVDPCCGSGTFLLEAADVLLDRAPGIARQQWGFVGWKGHDAEAWRQLVAEARDRVRAPVPGRLFGFDIDAEQVSRARKNAGKAGISAMVDIERGALAAVQPPTSVREELPRGLVVTNPPYGERMGSADEVERLWHTLGDVLRHRFLGWHAYLLAGDRLCARSLGLKAGRQPLFNGPLDVRLLDVPISIHPPRGPAER